MPDEAIASITIEGVDELVSKFINGDKVAEQLLVTAMGQAVDFGVLNASTYPPESDANQPPPPYYRRGTGTQYATFNRMESQQLDKHWDGKVELEDNGVTGIISNPVSYAPFVHGTATDPTIQQWYHTLHGWRTLHKIAEDIEPRVKQIFSIFAKQFSSYLRGKT